MKRLVSAAALCALGVVAIGGCTIEFDAEDAVDHEFGPDHFEAGGMLNVTDPVEGDAFLAGGQVAIASQVKGDLVVLGGEVSVGGSVGDDLYAAGGDVKLDSIVSGNARLAGGDVSVGPATVIAGAATLTGARVTFDGNTHEDLDASGASVRLNCEVHGDAEVRSEELVIGPETRIRGRLVYHGPVEPEVPEGAVIAGGVEYHAANAGRFFERSDSHREERGHGVGSVLWFVGVFVAGALFLLLFPGYSTRAADAIAREPLKVLGLGLAILVCVPFLTLALLITVIGIPLALLVIPLYLLLVFLGWVTAALFVAQRGLAVARSGKPATLGWRLLALLLGLVALALLQRIPLVGGLVMFVALMAGVGALVFQAWTRRDHRPHAVA
jgi:hypothetical protein